MDDKIENIRTFFSLKEAADYSHVTRQAVYIAVHNGKLKATKKDSKWCLTKEDIDEYRANKYNRDKRKFNGEPCFDLEQGILSINQVTILMSERLKKRFSSQRLYYLVRSGQLKAFRKGVAWVIKKEDAEELLQQEMNRGAHQDQMRFA